MEESSKIWDEDKIVRASIIIIKDHKHQIYGYNKLFPEFYDLLDTCRNMHLIKEKTTCQIFDWGNDMKEKYNTKYYINHDNLVLKSEEIITDFFTEKEVRRKIYLLFFSK